MKKLYLSIVTLILVSVCGVAHGETVRILSTNLLSTASGQSIRLCWFCRRETIARAILTMTSTTPSHIP